MLQSRTKRLRPWGFLLAAAVAVFGSTCAQAQRETIKTPSKVSCKPHYRGELLLRPQRDGRTMSLAKPFAYIAADCTVWEVPAEAVIDGASIPTALWPIIGGPFEGKYRLASIVHDWFCDLRSRSWQSVHRMFYEAMLASGVSTSLAKVMYFGVYYGGPRWSSVTVRNVLIANSNGEGGVDRALPNPSRDVTIGPSRNNDLVGCNGYLARSLGIECPKQSVRPQSTVVGSYTTNEIVIDPGRIDDNKLREMIDFIKTSNPSLEQIELASETLRPANTVQCPLDSVKDSEGVCSRTRAKDNVAPTPPNTSSTGSLSGRNLGAFCTTAVGRFGPGPINPIGTICSVTTPGGLVMGTVSP